MAYSEKVLDHYENPRNVGSFDAGDESVGTGMVGAPACGDVMRLQIKVSQEGVIAGTFYNESTGTTHPVEGMVDEETQRAVWKAADGTNPDLVMETGIYNLTQDQAEVLVHFGPEQTQTVLLVRLDETERPESSEAPQ